MSIVNYKSHENYIKREFLEKASPSLVWSTDTGIVIVAGNTDKLESRIHRVFDRIACLTIGSFPAGSALWKSAVNKSSVMALDLCRGSVRGKLIVQDISTEVMASFYSSPRPGPFFGAEGVFLEVAPDRLNDYMAHVNFMGRVKVFDGIGLLNNDGPEPSQEAKKDKQQYLSKLWTSNISPEDIISIIKNDSFFAKFLERHRMEVVLLDREMVKQRRFKEVFRRLY